MRFVSCLFAAASLGLASSIAAQMRSLEVPNDKGWQHAQTGIILTSRLGDFQRTELVDNGKSELDVAATYRGSSQADTASIYLFRPGIANVPIWFDRSHYAMTVNPQIKLGAPLIPITPFAPPGTNTPSGLRVTYSLKEDGAGGTGLAMMPFGDWILAVRFTSPTMSAPDVDAALIDILGKIRWPSARPTAQVAAPIAPCANPLKTKRAKLIQPDIAQALIGATLSNIADKKTHDTPAADGPPIQFCRDGSATPEYAVYRSDQSNDGYFLALGDAGIAASVFPGLSLSDRKEFAVTLATHDSFDTYPSFNALPEPKQVFELVTTRGPISRATRGGSDIIIAPTNK